jgi:hypothetical protein
MAAQAGGFMVASMRPADGRHAVRRPVRKTRAPGQTSYTRPRPKRAPAAPRISGEVGDVTLLHLGAPSPQHPHRKWRAYLVAPSATHRRGAMAAARGRCPSAPQGWRASGVRGGMCVGGEGVRGKVRRQGQMAAAFGAMARPKAAKRSTMPGAMAAVRCPRPSAPQLPPPACVGLPTHETPDGRAAGAAARLPPAAPLRGALLGRLGAWVCERVPRGRGQSPWRMSAGAWALPVAHGWWRMGDVRAPAPAGGCARLRWAGQAGTYLPPATAGP